MDRKCCSYIWLFISLCVDLIFMKVIEYKSMELMVLSPSGSLVHGKRYLSCGYLLCQIIYIITGDIFVPVHVHATLHFKLSSQKAPKYLKDSNRRKANWCFAAEVVQVGGLQLHASLRSLLGQPGPLKEGRVPSEHRGTYILAVRFAHRLMYFHSHKA